MTPKHQQEQVAVLIPAYNEAATIKDVIEQFHDQLPHAQIWIIDNNSRDATAQLAAETFASKGIRGGVLREPRQGKALAVRRAVHAVEADVYVMVDADTTYPAEAVHALIAPVFSGVAEMVVGDRISGGHYQRENKRAFHGFGNGLVLGLINVLFKSTLNDVMSGYRAFSRLFIKTYPILIDGFEIETDLTLHALDKRQHMVEVPIEYRDRPDGSASKLNTYRDGYRVLKTIFRIFKNYRPMAFFGLWAGLFAAFALVSGAVPVVEFARTHFITHVPLAILATGLAIFSLVLIAIGLILDTVAHNARFAFELHLLSVEASRPAVARAINAMPSPSHNLSAYS